ncbi:MAG: hypothetical protein FJ336_04540 [Sphingomonadales bacterium]|nr:hypothetical protein [Sphingomonadales bacterium]
MNENHTLHNQLILYVFNELSPSESASFEHQLISDPELQEEHRVMNNLLHWLQADLQPFPSPTVSPAVLARLETLMTD